VAGPAVRSPCHTPFVRRFVTLDLETVPDEGLVAAVDGRAGSPYPEQLQRVVADRRARTGGRSDFLPLPYHRPVAACLLEAVDDGGLLSVTDVEAWTDRKDGEAAFLDRLWSRLDDATVVTFHGRGFDLPVLELRSLKLGVPAPRWFAGARRPGSAEHLDVKELLAAPGSSGAAPLDLYAKLVGLPGKEGVAGADVGALYAAGELDRIVAYCMTDVVQTFLLLLRHRLVEGSLSPDGWSESAELARERLPRLFARSLTPGERAPLEGFLERCTAYFGERRPSPRRRRAL
jgi:3'-5' exonuclease